MKLAERCFEAPARVERIIHLAVIGEMDTDLFEWLLDEGSDALAELLCDEGQTLDDLIPPEEDGGRNDRWARREALGEAINWRERWGWLVEVATPVKEHRGDQTGFSYSWGYYTSKVFSGETYEAALEKGLTWAENMPVREVA